MSDDALPDERPVERLYRFGVETLSDAELVAALTGCGMDTSRDLIRDGLPAFASTEWTVGGRQKIRRTTAARIAAALELGRRVAAHPGRTSDPITRPSDLAQPLIARYSYETQEHLCVILLDSKHRVIAERELFRGTIDSAMVSPREIVKAALDLNAAAVVLSHNHPSGDAKASAEDIEFTKRCVDACRIFRIDVVDHLIIGMNRFYSMKEAGLIYSSR